MARETPEGGFAPPPARNRVKPHRGPGDNWPATEDEADDVGVNSNCTAAIPGPGPAPSMEMALSQAHQKAGILAYTSQCSETERSLLLK